MGITVRVIRAGCCGWCYVARKCRCKILSLVEYKNAHNASHRDTQLQPFYTGYEHAIALYNPKVPLTVLVDGPRDNSARAEEDAPQRG